MLCSLLPTFCAAAGVEVPADAHVDGVNLLPALTGKGPVVERKTVFWQMELFKWATQPGGKPKPDATEVARSGRWKLMALDGEPVALYDLQDDPGEQENLLGRHSDVENRLAAELNAWLADPRIPYGQY